MPRQKRPIKAERLNLRVNPGTREAIAEIAKECGFQNPGALMDAIAVAPSGIRKAIAVMLKGILRSDRQ